MVKILRDIAKQIPGARKMAIALGIVKPPKKSKSKRKSTHTIAAELQKLASTHDYSLIDVERVTQWATENTDPTFMLVAAVVLYRCGRYEEAKNYVAKVRSDDPRLGLHIVSLFLYETADLGRHDLSILAYEYRHLNGRLADIKPGIMTGQARYFADIYRYHSEQMSEFQNDDPRGYVIICDHGGPVISGLMVPLGYELRKQGYAVCSAVAGRMPDTPDPHLASVSGRMRTDGRSFVDQPSNHLGLNNDWTIDWKNQIIAADGINHFSTFHESMTKVARGHDPDLTNPAQKNAFDGLMRRADMMLTICKRAEQIAVSSGKPIRMATIDTHFAPWGIVRRWCQIVGKKHDIHVIAFSTAYENYYSNLSTKIASTLTLEDMTANPDTRHPFLGTRNRFLSYLTKNPITEEDIDDAKRNIMINRSNTGENDVRDRADIIFRVNEAKKNGGKVFAAFGKVLIDFAAPDDRGNVFGNFEEWISFLAEKVNGTKNILIVKPHPHEVRTEIVRNGVRYLRSMMPDKLPPNVIFLGHTTFNSHELAEHIDCAFIWNGTIAIEFPVLGCPVIAESIWAARDYPVGNPLVTTREEYSRILQGEQCVELPDETKTTAAGFLSFMRSTDVALPFKYVKRGATNETIGANEIDEFQMRKLYDEGDPWAVVAASRFFEYSKICDSPSRPLQCNFQAVHPDTLSSPLLAG